MHIALPVAIECGAALVAPFLLWGVLAVAARKNPGVLHRISPAFNACYWITGLGWLVIALPFFNARSSIMLPFILAALANLGLQFVRFWLQLRVVPAPPKEEPDGWWPAKREL
jgi:hypothetical protein